MSGLQASRREVLTGAGAALAGGTAVFGSTGPDADAAATAAASATVILQDPRLVLPDAVRRRLAGNGARVIALEADPVRQWRGDGAAMLAARGTRLLGVTRWPEFLLVRGLAEESGRRVRHQRLDAASGAIVWLIV